MLLSNSAGTDNRQEQASESGGGHGSASLALDVSVIVPTRNEAGNVTELIRRVDAALSGRRAEIVIVDDSDDDTPAVAMRAAELASLRVRVLHRDGAQRTGGLGTAVLAGLQSSDSTWVVVMDADLQHPPEKVAELVREGIDSHADLVVATRYADGGTNGGLSSQARVVVSSSATLLAKGAFPRRLNGCTDPMSGFFALRRAAIDATTLRPHGFKILLEIIGRSPRLRIAEVPFEFGERLSGQSKASWREGLRFARQLLGLRLAASMPARMRWTATALGFALVGLTGIAVNSAALWAFEHSLGFSLLVAATLATQVSTTWNFLLTDLLVFKGPKERPWWLRFLGFALINNAVLLVRLPVLDWLVRRLGMDDIVANVVTLVAAFVIRYIVADKLLFARKKASMTDLITGPAAPRPGLSISDTHAERSRSGPVNLVVDLRDVATPAATGRTGPSAEFPWRYDIHGLVRIGSAVRMSELDSFQTDSAAAFDVVIHRGVVGKGRLRSRSCVTQYATLPAVSYQEHLGRFGSDFHIDMSRADGPIDVTVGPMLVRSPHVLYTNVIEALLRFLLVARGHMLLHSACVELDGHGVMLSALTDTGKTGTVLRLLREKHAKFLSDDMTIIGPDGVARTFPKPMTISQHTLQAVHADSLSRTEFLRLRVQSRLHSKQGRAVGSRLGSMNLPIMSLNAATQFLVPPPKYRAERLVPCEAVTEIRVEDLFIIERGPASHSRIDDREALLDELIDNTNDAYGFPPFRYFAPALVVDGMGYEELCAAERRILASAMAGVTAHRLAASDYSWPDRIPELLGGGNAAVPTVPVARIVAGPSVAKDLDEARVAPAGASSID
jgi:glycosyltransferase involved in cell wall biosynthesis